MQLEGLVTKARDVWQPSWRRVSICGARVSLQCAVSPSLAASSAKCPVVACPLLLPFSSLLLTPLYSLLPSPSARLQRLFSSRSFLPRRRA